MQQENVEVLDPDAAHDDKVEHIYRYIADTLKYNHGTSEKYSSEDEVSEDEMDITTTPKTCDKLLTDRASREFYAIRNKLTSPLLGQEVKDLNGLQWISLDDLTAPTRNISAELEKRVGERRRSSGDLPDLDRPTVDRRESIEPIHQNGNALPALDHKNIGSITVSEKTKRLLERSRSVDKLIEYRRPKTSPLVHRVVSTSSIPDECACSTTKDRSRCSSGKLLRNDSRLSSAAYETLRNSRTGKSNPSDEDEETCSTVKSRRPQLVSQTSYDHNFNNAAKDIIDAKANIHRGKSAPNLIYLNNGYVSRRGRSERQFSTNSHFSKYNAPQHRTRVFIGCNKGIPEKKHLAKSVSNVSTKTVSDGQIMGGKVNVNERRKKMFNPPSTKTKLRSGSQLDT